MTVHGAKGLEFERVLLTGMEEEMFPYKGIDPGERDELEEERRLAYVAITRARRELAMTHTQMRQIFGTTRWNRPSRFLGGASRRQLRARRDTRDGLRRPDPPATSIARSSASPSRVHGVTLRSPPREPAPEGRFVDHEFFDDRSHDVTDMPLRRGARVQHARFGEGEVRSVVSMGEPAVVAFFPGWGEKKILARFLKPA